MLMMLLQWPSTELRSLCACNWRGTSHKVQKRAQAKAILKQASSSSSKHLEVVEVLCLYQTPNKQQCFSWGSYWLEEKFEDGKRWLVFFKGKVLP